MSEAFQPLDFLYTLEQERVEEALRACSLLPRQPAAAFLESLLVQKEQKLGGRFDAIIQIAAEAVAAHKVQRRIADWPFEHFWQNPNEPRHSRLLGYFIDPTADHGCGDFLLGKLLDTLNMRLPKDNWQVAVERSHIDILLTRECESDKHAIIVENKVNWATDQPDQLHTYVDCVRALGFDDKNIHVLYLPLTAAKDPSVNSLGDIKERTQYRKITFDKDILGWLENVLAVEEDLPAGMRNGMRDNLAHYRNLIRYLIRQQEESIMHAEILKKLETTTPLPTWNQVDSLATSAAALKECVESVIRGKLLLNISSLLEKQRCPELCISFCDSSGQTIECLQSEYDERFTREVNLGVTVNEAVRACVGVFEENGKIAYTGYMKRGQLEQQNKVGTMAVQEAESRSKGKDAVCTSHPRWYAYCFHGDVSYANATDPATAGILAQELLDMHKALCEAIKSNDSRP